MTITSASNDPHTSARLAAIKEPDPRVATTVYNESTFASSELLIPIEVELPRPAPGKSPLSQLLTKFAAEKMAPAEERLNAAAVSATAFVDRHKPAVTRLIVGKDAYEFMKHKHAEMESEGKRPRLSNRDRVKATGKAFESRSFLFDPIGWLFRKNVVRIGKAFGHVQKRFFYHATPPGPGKAPQAK